jgi:hypothetical protein
MTKKLLTGCLALTLTFSALAASQKEIELQGNFEGSTTGPGGEYMSVTAQIVALGQGKHVAKIHVADAVVEVNGQTEGKPEDGLCLYNEVVNLPDMGDYKITAKVEDKVFSGTADGPSGKHEFSLKRVEKGSPTLGLKAPEGAIVLMDGSSMDAWVQEPFWNIRGGVMNMSGHSIRTKEEFPSMQLHLEFKTPFMPNEAPGSQGRGNSGVYVFGRYEVQVLDSFTDAPKDNLCGGIYQKAVPIASACLPPEEWQTYDMEFQAPKFDANGVKTSDAVITVKLNGTLIHDKVVLPSCTPGGVSDQEAAKGVLMLQDHHDKVEYRNIWVKPLD